MKNDLQIQSMVNSLNKKSSSIDKHFVLNDLIEAFWQKGNFKNSIYYCEMDMNLINENNELIEFLVDCEIPSLYYIDQMNEYKKFIPILTEIFNQEDIVIQKDLYKNPEFEDKKESLRSFFYWLERGKFIQRIKKGTSYEVKLKVPLKEIF
jgi:hypothetical protein